MEKAALNVAHIHNKNTFQYYAYRLLQWLLGGSGQGDLPGGVSAHGGCLPRGCTPPPCEQNDRQV